MLQVLEINTAESYNLPELDLLDINEIYAVPGMMSTGTTSLPPPFINLAKMKPKRGRLSCPTNHYYWLRADIEAWVARVGKKTVARR